VIREQVRAAAIEYAKADNAMAFHGLGVTEHSHGSKTVMTIADIAMMTGNIGRPGVGVNPSADKTTSRAPPTWVASLTRAPATSR
jgi:formate dehydrogenase major subunit